MNFGWDLFHIAYGFSFVALFLKDILWLRLVILGSNATFLVIGLLNNNGNAVVWAVLILGINLWRTGWLIWERRKVWFPDFIEELYQEVFKPVGLNRQEMRALWTHGRRLDFAGGPEPVIAEGKHPDWVAVIRRGEARVLKAGLEVGRVKQGRFLGEMSYLTGGAATADVVSDGPLELWVWDRERLNAWRAQAPVLWAKVQSVIGRDLVLKVSENHKVRTQELQQEAAG